MGLLSNLFKKNEKISFSINLNNNDNFNPEEYARYNVDLREFVPECVISKLMDKIK